MFLATSTVIGIKAKNGIVLAVEKIIHSKLVVPNTGRKIHSVDLHAGLVCTMSLL
jgi:20S proteasome subunit alpha 7